MKEIHRIDDHGHVCRILPDRIGVLLYWHSANFQQDFLPSDQRLRRPVAIGPFDDRCSILGDFANDCLHVRFRNIIRVNQDSQPHFNYIAHKSILSLSDLQSCQSC